MKFNLSLASEFKRNPYKPRYIAIEGIDGSGKSTQVERVRKYLEEKGQRVVTTAEPTKNLPIGKLVRDILYQKVRIPKHAFQSIYSADRVAGHEEIILPSLSSGKTVITHRCFWSAVAYGIYDEDNADYSFENAMQILVSQGAISAYYQFTAPDITFLLDVTAETAMARLNKMDKEKDIYERREKLEKIAKGYRWLAKAFPSEIIRIDGERPLKEVASAILAKIKYQI